jgi:hypothetical protein
MSGPTEEAVKKTIIPTNAGEKVTRSSFRPTKNAKNMKSGNKSPNIRTGGFV